jgi:hypothetical protein
MERVTEPGEFDVWVGGERTRNFTESLLSSDTAERIA